MTGKLGLIGEVFVNCSGDDFSLDGVSSVYNTLTIIGDGVAGVFHPSDERPPVLLVKEGGRVKVVPCDYEGNILKGMWAFGGNFLWTSDSRFPSPQPIKIHDRDMRKEN
jgi:hypothetical protein